jgi:pyridoxine kinase
MQTILSIQSHVALGYVGNRAAVFPLQRLGFEVMAVDTVQFSNHTGYGEWTGKVFAPGDISEVIEGIAARDGLAKCDAVLSGYLGDVSLGRVIADTVERVRAARPGALYCCDPVMGDVGRGFFVRPGIPDFIRSRLLPLADILTPNQFELEFITGGPVHTLEQAIKAGAAARRLGPKVVLITSLRLPEAPADQIEMVVDTADGTWMVATPRLKMDPPPSGAGDCLAALFLAHYLISGDATSALSRAAAAIFAIIEATQQAGTRELQLIAAQDSFVKPRRTFGLDRLR